MPQMPTIIICPGIHPAELTDLFVRELQKQIPANYFVLSTETDAPYSAIAISQWLDRQPLAKTEPLCWIAFSAGVVGSIGAAIRWKLQGGQIGCLIAVDGWGMPLAADFPIYRISHDYFTHWSSGLLGGGTQGFYADPDVEHLDLWRSPTNISGWLATAPGCRTRMTLTDYLAQAIEQNQSQSIKH